MLEMNDKLSIKEFLKLADLFRQSGPQTKYPDLNAWRKEKAEDEIFWQKEQS
jgi:hypothetical protein